LASEGGHWYNREGTPVYQVPSADGKRMIEPDIRHARKQNLVPGVTQIIKCAAKPQLTAWMVEQAILASLTLPRRPLESDADYLRRVYDDSQEQARKAAEEGTAIHAAIEQSFKSESYDPAKEPFVRAAREAVASLGEAWTAEYSFASRDGYGSKIDLFGEAAIIDIKTKEFDDPKKKMAYDEHLMQLAAYFRIMPNNNGVTCGNVFISRTVPGLWALHVWTPEDLERGWKMFKALLDYWKSLKKYDPSW
jgi:hypothetical protein